MTFIGALPHTHLTGVEIWTKIVRKGVDIGYLNYNKYYDFNYQNHLTIDPPIVVTKVDLINFEFFDEVLYLSWQG